MVARATVWGFEGRHASSTAPRAVRVDGERTPTSWRNRRFDQRAAALKGSAASCPTSTRSKNDACPSQSSSSGLGKSKCLGPGCFSRSRARPGDFRRSRRAGRERARALGGLALGAAGWRSAQTEPPCCETLVSLRIFQTGHRCFFGVRG